MEAIIADPMRIPYFEIDEHSIRDPKKDEFDEMVETARSTPFTLRPVKQNALKASFLFHKQQELPSNFRRTRHRCRMSIHEVLRSVSDSLKDRIPIGNIQRNLRRSPEQRKKDWRAAMSRVGVEDTDNSSSLQRISSPVLPSIMLNSNMNRRLDIAGVPVQPVSLHHQSLAIASVWTNMVFDLEMINTVLDEYRVEGRPTFKHSCDGTNVLESAYPQGHLKDSSSGVIRLPESSELWSIQPVPKQSPFKNTIGRLARNIPKTWDTDFPGYDFGHGCTRMSASKDIKLCGWKHEEEFLFRFLRSLRKPPMFVNDLRAAIPIKPQNPSRNLEEIDILEFEQDTAFVRDRSCPRAEVSSKVILSGNLLKHEGESVPNSLVAGLEARPLSTTKKDSCFSELHRFLRQRSKIRELAAPWSSGPREVLRRCHLHRTILSQVSQKRGVLLEFTAKRRHVLGSKHIRSRGFTEFEKAADTLLRTFSARFRGFLPLSVDLSEGLHHAFHQEKSHQITQIVSFERLLEPHNELNFLKRNQSSTLTGHIYKNNEARMANLSYSRLEDEEDGNAEDVGNGDITSYESSLNDILTSDEDGPESEPEPEPEPEPAMVVVQREPMLQHMKHKRNREEEMKSKAGVLGKQSREPESHKVRLRVPENLMCSPWCLRLADHCVAKMPRGTLILPPSLSALPSLCIIINTHLSNQVQDQRVAIICESESDISSGLSSYLDHSFACKTSVEVIRRWNFPREPRYPSLNGCAAQILILDSFDFTLPPGVSLLLVLVCEPCVVRSTAQAGFRRRPFTVDPQWPRPADILIAPIDCWIPFPAYIDTAKRLSLELKTQAVMFVADYDDVHFSVLLAKPRALFLAPLKETSELISVIDSHSSSALVQLRKFFSEAELGYRNAASQSLPDLSVSYLKSILEDKLFERNSETYRNLETVYYLRQARSYALYDGFDVAMAFLVQCMDELQPETSQVLREVIKEADAIHIQASNTRKDHPIVSPVTAHMKRMQDAFKKEAPSLCSIHRRSAFLPLIVADSREAVDGFRRGRTSAKLLFEADERDIAICWLSDLISISLNETKSVQQKRVLDRLKEFTHIYHIMDGRENTHSESKFPPCIMQLVHAGRTRLITVIVDERRDIESIWTKSHKMYDTLRKHIGDQGRFSGLGGVQTLREMNWEVVTHMLSSLWL